MRNPSFKQFGQTWSDQLVLGSTNPSDTLHAVGCRVSAASMILNYYNHATDPGLLNQYLTSTLPASPSKADGLLDFSAIPSSTTFGQTNGAAGVAVHFESDILPLSGTRTEITAAIATAISSNGPVMLRVPVAKHGLSDYPQYSHSIVAWQVLGGVIYINDPGSTNSGTTLDSYIAYVNSSSNVSSNPSLQLPSDLSFLLGTAFTYASGPSINPVLLGGANCPIEFVLTDPYGNRLGYDPVHDLHFSEIANSVYQRLGFTISPDGDLIPPTDSFGAIEFRLGQITNGNYTLDIYGIGAGDWSIHFGDSDQNGYNPYQYTFSGLATDGSFTQIVFAIPESSTAALIGCALVGGLIKRIRRQGSAPTGLKPAASASRAA